MEKSGHRMFNGIGSAVRKKRSQTSRRPKPEPLPDDHDYLPLATTPSSNEVSRDSSDEIGESNTRRKESSLSLCLSRLSSAVGSKSDEAKKRNKEGLSYGERNGESQSLEQLAANVDGFRKENKVKRVKLKVDGITRTIHANSPANGTSSAKNAHSSDISRSRQKHNHQEHRVGSDRRIGLRGVPWKDFSGGGFSLVKEDSSMSRTSGKNTAANQGDKSPPVRKSKKARKKHARDSDFDDDDEDDEIRYLEKLKMPKNGMGYRKNDEESGQKLRKLSALERTSGGVDSEEEYSAETDPSIDDRREVTLTTRQRALRQPRKGASPGIEFPDGLPPPAPRKQKEKLTVVEQQLKRAEALQRRRMQVEKANREAEAEAIKKILGQDSNRKKQEDRKKKRQEELAQEKAANAVKLASSSIRWVMGPSGTVVTFPKDSGLPSIFSSKPHSYPPPREKCAGPSCANPYKYRDSKTKLPLCSLQCYKAVQGLVPSAAAR